MSQATVFCHVETNFRFVLIHPIDSLYTVESVKDTVPVIERIFGAKHARQW